MHIISWVFAEERTVVAVWFFEVRKFQIIAKWKMEGKTSFVVDFRGFMKIRTS